MSRSPILSSQSRIVDCLAALTPPSPILRPDDLSTTWSSQEIPIFLDLAIDESDDLRVMNAAVLYSTDQDGHEFLSSPSVESIMTSCTFGPLQERVENAGPSPFSRTTDTFRITDDEEDSESVSLSPLDRPFSMAADQEEQSSMRSTEYYHDQSCSNPGLTKSSRSFSGSMSSLSVAYSVSPIIYSEAVSATPSCRPGPREDYPISAPICLDEVFQTDDDVSVSGLSTRIGEFLPSSSTLSTVAFAPPSPCPLLVGSRSPSWSMCSDMFTEDYVAHKDHDRFINGKASSDLGNAGGYPSCPLQAAPSAHQGSMPSSVQSTPLIVRDTGSWSFIPRSGKDYCGGSVRSSLSSTSSQESYSTASSSSIVGGSQSVSLPKKLSYLKKTMIELWIDQEGFRSVRPLFKLMGYCSASSNPSAQWNADKQMLISSNTRFREDLEETAGTAHFMPVKRQTFAFHHATLDTPPLLRRLTANSDESRDYISRQAYLTIKTNGVYIVRGSETHGHPRRYGDADCQSLHWQFEYVVEDRRAETTGKMMSGEKTLTPLRFSCSPGLLRPSSGKKIGVVQVVKKNVAHKLIAEKLEPPRMPLLLSQPMIGESTISATQPESRKRIGIWSMHARSRSQAKKLEQEDLRMASHSGDSQNMDFELYPRPSGRPRAASVCELGSTQPSSRRLSLDVTVSNRAINRHIRPHSELSRLISPITEDSTTMPPALTVPAHKRRLNAN